MAQWQNNRLLIFSLRVRIQPRLAPSENVAKITLSYIGLLLFIAKEYDGTAHFKFVNNCLNTNIYFYLGTAGGQSCQSSNLYLNVVHFFNISVN